MEGQHTPLKRPGTTWEQMETITESGDAAGMGVVTLNQGELMDTRVRSALTSRSCHAELCFLFFFFFLKKRASSFKLLLKMGEAPVPSGSASQGARRTPVHTHTASPPGDGIGYSF